MEFRVERKVLDRSVTFQLKGMLDITTTNLIDQCLEEIEDIETLIIDFSGLEFIDSTGIGSIMNAMYLSQEKEFKLKLKGVDELTDTVFKTVGLYQILEAFQGEVV